jgi:hypothetical protein
LKNGVDVYNRNLKILKSEKITKQQPIELKDDKKVTKDDKKSAKDDKKTPKDDKKTMKVNKKIIKETKESKSDEKQKLINEQKIFIEKQSAKLHELQNEIFKNSTENCYKMCYFFVNDLLMVNIFFLFHIYLCIHFLVELIINILRSNNLINNNI